MLTARTSTKHSKMQLCNKHKPQLFKSPSISPNLFQSGETAKWISSNFALKVKFTSRLTSIKKFSPMGDFFFKAAIS